MAIRSLSTASISTGAKRSKFWDQTTVLNPYAAGSYESIQTISLTGNQQTITFTSIPQTYKHLEIRCISRDTYPNTYPGIYATFNGNGSGTFNYIYGDGNGGAGTVGGSVSSYTGNSVGNDQSAGQYMPMIARIPDYTNTSRVKMMNLVHAHSRNDGGSNNSAVAFWSWSSGSTAAVTEILFGEGDPNFKLMPGSHWALYGIKG
jgi:hypothetical protein